MSNEVCKLRVIVHLVASLQFWFALYYHCKYAVNPNEEKFGGQLKYLTIWDVYIQASFFTLCLLNDLIGNENGPKSKLGKIKDFFQASFAFPLSLFVSIVFWGLYAIDRELIFPEHLDGIFPSWLNHIMHTNIFVFQILELALSNCKYPTRCQGITALSMLMLAYITWVLIIFNKVNHWVYPVLTVLNWPQRVLFFGGCIGFAVSMYLLGELLNSTLFSGQSSQNKKPAVFVKKEKQMKKQKKYA